MRKNVLVFWCCKHIFYVFKGICMSLWWFIFYDQSYSWTSSGGRGILVSDNPRQTGQGESEDLEFCRTSFMNAPKILSLGSYPKESPQWGHPSLDALGKHHVQLFPGFINGCDGNLIDGIPRSMLHCPNSANRRTRKTSQMLLKRLTFSPYYF